MAYPSVGRLSAHHIEGHIAHRFHATGHYGILMTTHYRLGSEHDRFHARSAHFIDGCCRSSVGET